MAARHETEQRTDTIEVEPRGWGAPANDGTAHGGRSDAGGEPAADGPAAAGGDGGRPNAARWRAFGVCLVAAFMTLLDVSIVNVALPSIRQGLAASQTQLQWVVSGYALAFGLVLVPAGRLGDLRGRRTVFVASLALFTAASGGCGLAQSASWLIVARLLQGVAGGF